MEQNLAFFLPLDSNQKNSGKSVSNSGKPAQLSLIDCRAPNHEAFDFRAILAGIERHAYRIYAQPNGRMDKLEQLANLLVGSATVLLASVGGEECNSGHSAPVSSECVLAECVLVRGAGGSPDQQQFLSWLFEQLYATAVQIARTSSSKTEAVTQFALFLEETSNSLEEFANRYGSLDVGDDWSL